jgi:hypothetical protein
MMDGWPLDESEYKSILKDFKARCAALIARPMVEYVHRNRLDWHEIAPNPPFNYAVVHLWSTGARVPNRDHIARIKRSNGLSDSDVPIPDDSAVYLVAAAETISWIRDQWFAAPGESGKVITAYQVKALDIAVKLEASQLAREDVSDWTEILEAIRKSVPKAEIWTLSDLTKLRKDWSHAHCGFYDALIEGNFPDER